jgi:alkylation response protein AidB-like acyl-CoA dehydrogenase
MMLHHSTQSVQPGSQSPAQGQENRFLQRERAVMERFLPGLDARLAALTLEQLEQPGNPGIALLKAVKGPNLFIPKKCGGLGATALEGVQVLRALASRAPSLGIVCTMHNFSMCTLVAYAAVGVEHGEDLLCSLAEHSMLLASGFAEGRTGANPLDMRMQARRGPDDTWMISGYKRPCTLSQSMDFLTAGVSATDTDGTIRRGVALIPADTPGITRRPFWNTPILAGAESDELILTDVVIPSDFLFLADDHVVLDPVEVLGYLWFQLILSATYLGMGSALVERVLHAQKGTPAERIAVVSDVESAMAAVENVARGLMHGEDTNDLLARMLYVRIAAQMALERSAMRSAELLGGMAFLSSMEVSYLLAATRAMAFHPPARLYASTRLDDYLRGAPLDLS